MQLATAEVSGPLMQSDWRDTKSAVGLTPVGRFNEPIASNFD